MPHRGLTDRGDKRHSIRQGQERVSIPNQPSVFLKKVFNHQEKTKLHPYSFHVCLINVYLY